MLAKSYSGAICGVEAHTVEIEVHAGPGLPQFTIVGLPDAAVKEAKDRVQKAIENSLYGKLESSITVNLAPADVRKEGPLYDLPIAITLLTAREKIKCHNLADWAFAGELALSGEIRHVNGILPIVIEMKRIGKKGIIVPFENAREASIVDGISIYPVHTLREAAEFLEGNSSIEPVHSNVEDLVNGGETYTEDFADVKGQNFAKRAIEVAVAGGHNLLMIGSPGSGKTMLARRIPSILPPLTPCEAIEVTRIHSVAGTFKATEPVITHRPFRAPHHTVSDAGLLGGGTHPVPGEVSLAHRGVLFLDELPEFHRHVLEVMRQPMEDGHVAIARACAAYDFPSRFMLVAAMNPCPCGWADDPKHECRCSSRQKMLYRGKLSGPLLDRIDLQIEVPPLSLDELSKLPAGESSKTIRERVVTAREIQRRRFGEKITCNAEMKSRDLKDYCKLSEKSLGEIRRMISDLDLSARAYDRVLKMSRTIADLAGKDAVECEHVLESIRYRSLDNSYWG